MDVPSSSLSTALAAISHSNRLIKLQAPNEGLVVERFAGEEALCGDMLLQIDCLSTDAYLETDSWLEQPLTLQLQLALGRLQTTSQIQLAIKLALQPRPKLPQARHRQQQLAAELLMQRRLAADAVIAQAHVQRT